MAHRSPENRGLLAAVAFLLLLVAVAAWLVTAPRRALREVPPESAVQAAARLVGEGYRPGDLVRVDPYWFTAPRRDIEALAGPFPFPFDAFDFSGHPDPLHILRFERLWVVAAFEALDQDDATRVGLPLRAAAPAWRGDGIRVSLHELPRDALRYDLLRSLGEAEVVRKGRRCQWDGEALRHRCHEQEWKDVYVALKDAGDAMRQCIYAEPHPAGAVLSITWPQVPMDGPLLLQTGFTQSAVRRTAGADTRLKLSVGGELVAEWVEPKNDYVWRRTWAPARGGAHDVSLEISAPEVGWRQLCIDGAVIAPEARSLFP